MGDLTASSESRCPHRGSERVVPVIYGLEKAERESLRGGPIAIGDVIGEDAKTWECRDCYHRWGRLADDAPDLMHPSPADQ
ncbi:MAG TPA: hypothetical protein VND96_14075 [Candidatus Micrarchaeaceae archaeon]|nr:hypothetical protein [Candidatus Micrarchaeaceae archaeon]